MTVADRPPAQRTDYWNRYYRDAAKTLATPSQFAVFVLGETDDDARMFDLGCGSGRDSLYFASRGRRVMGVDGSDAVIDHCAATATANGLDDRATFLASPIDAGDLAERLLATAPDAAGPVVVYARFFLHAITEAEESAFMSLAARLCRDGGRLAVEFRTKRDADQTKVTGAHYRRFIDPLALIATARSHGFDCAYFVEGFGYAKYKEDDAHVARLIFDRRL